MAYTGNEFSRSSSTLASKELTNKAVVWQNMKSLICFSIGIGSRHTYAMFSQAMSIVSIYDFFFLSLAVGMSYMYANYFIKQFTGRLSFEQNMNPLLGAINLLIVINEIIWFQMETCDTGMELEILINSLPFDSGNVCPDSNDAQSCNDMSTVINRCINNIKTNLSVTSAFAPMVNFTDTSETLDLPTYAAISIIILALSSLKPTALAQFLKLTIVYCMTATIIMVLFLSYQTKYFRTALGKIFDTSLMFTTMKSSMVFVRSIFCIGSIGVYDFGTVSPYTRVNYAVIVFFIVFLMHRILESCIAIMAVKLVEQCVYHDYRTSFIEMYAIVQPTSGHFLIGKGCFIIYVFTEVLFLVIIHLVLSLTIIGHLLNSECHRLKPIYIKGFFVCVTALWNIYGVMYIHGWIRANKKIKFIGGIASIATLDIRVGATTIISRYYLIFKKSMREYLDKDIIIVLMCTWGSLKMAVVFWMYGVERFSTDIEFWLQSRPSMYWKVCWVFLPISLMVFAISEMFIIYDLHVVTRKRYELSILFLLQVAVFIVAVIKIMVYYMRSNNFLGALRCTPMYGPTDKDLRRKRRRFIAEQDVKTCFHICLNMHDTYECIHIPPDEEPMLKTLVEP